MRRLHILVYAGVGLFGLTVIAVIIGFLMITATVPQLPEQLDDVFIGQPTQIYAMGTSGEPTLIGTFGGRIRVSIDQISPLFLRALIAVEDRHFYSHHGLDKLALLRSAWIDFWSQRKVQGGSTITQQLARNLVLSPEKRWLRKFKEILLAVQIERTFSKEKILEAYCNNVYFGADAYGVESAAQTYFGKHANELTLAESALLAGLLQNPSVYDAYQNFDRAKRRQVVVLDQMVQVGFIRSEERDTAARASLILKRLMTGQDGPYFLDYVKKAAVEAYGNDLVYYGGLKIYTTMDLALQRHAQIAVRTGLTQLDAAMAHRPGGGVQGALVAIEPQTGAIKAMVGGRNFAASPYNRAVQQNRLPGSGFKPFVYLTAIEQASLTPTTVVVDEPTTFPISGGKTWTPKNFEGTYQGPVVLKWALMQSINVVAAKLISQVGPEAVIETARRFGITSSLQPNLSLALGTSGVSPLAMASAFGTFASGGTYAQPMAIVRVEDYQGRVLAEQFPRRKQVASPQSIYQMVDMMRSVVDGGTAQSVRSLGFDRPCAGKTGTTSEYVDAWFTGFTPTLSVSVWTGYDDNRPMRLRDGTGVTGAIGAIPIWTAFMFATHQNQSVQDFSVPPGIEFISVNPKTGQVVTDEAADRLVVAMKAAS